MTNKFSASESPMTMPRPITQFENLRAMSRRQPIGYFMHPSYDAPVECLPTCLQPGEKPRYPTVAASEHISMKTEKSHHA
jgi:isopenicillin N synthase-like dioxygenase